MTERNQRLTAALKDVPLSGYEWAQWQDCENCYFGNQTRLRRMKYLQPLKDWLEMINIRGWCNYALRHNYNKDTTPWTCKDWQPKEKSK